jgi:hypothetical protein
MTNATSFTRYSLLTFLLCTPKASLVRRYGRIVGASEDHQRGYDCECSKAKVHGVSYSISLRPKAKALPRRRGGLLREMFSYVRLLRSISMADAGAHSPVLQ